MYGFQLLPKTVCGCGSSDFFLLLFQFLYLFFLPAVFKLTLISRLLLFEMVLYFKIPFLPLLFFIVYFLRVSGHLLITWLIKSRRFSLLVHYSRLILFNPFRLWLFFSVPTIYFRFHFVYLILWWPICYLHFLFILICYNILRSAWLRWWIKCSRFRLVLLCFEMNIFLFYWFFYLGSASCFFLLFRLLYFALLFFHNCFSWVILLSLFHFLFLLLFLFPSFSLFKTLLSIIDPFVINGWDITDLFLYLYFFFIQNICSLCSDWPLFQWTNCLRCLNTPDHPWAFNRFIWYCQ